MIAIGVCVRPRPGEVESGDACVAIPRARGVTIAMADGLGHGPRAATAANAFVASVRDGPELGLEEMFARAHGALLKTRGAVAAVARFDDARGEVEIAGIGNIGILLARSGSTRAEHLIVTPGVLGSAYRAIRPHVLPFGVGDVLVMHSDGVRSRFDSALLRALPAQAAAEAMLRNHAKDSDDAACLVARAVTEASEARRAAPAERPAPDRAIPVRMRGDAECVAEATRAFARGHGFGPRAQWEVSIAASELATNILKFAGAGEMHLRHDAVPEDAIVVEAIDHGSGIPDVAAAIADGYSEGAPRTPDRPRREGQGLGLGLGTVHRMMDRVEITSDAEQGTRVVAWKVRARSSK